jgi:HlyD family secretion protein
MKKALIVILLIAVAASAYLYYSGYFEKKTPIDRIELSGTIETTEVDVSFQVPGRVLKVEVEEGDTVARGQVIAILDDRDIRQQLKMAQAARNTIKSQLPQLNTRILTSREQEARQLQQTQAQIDQARLQWESIRKGSRDEQIDQARYAVDQARHSLDFRKKELVRAQNLFRDGAMPAQQRDVAQTAYLTAKDQYRQARENYRLLVAGPRQEDIDAAEKRVAQAEAAYELVKTQSLQTKQMEQQVDILAAQMKQADEAVEQARIQLDHTRLLSPLDGVVLVKAREPGEVVGAATTILTLANIKKVYLKAYVGEQDLGRVKLGQVITITTDSFKDKTYEGKIYYISDKAEFTPKNLTTKEDRVKLVYRIKAEVDNPEQELKPGMIADGTIKI